MNGLFQPPDVPSRALIDQCVHCGFCLPTCPTYLLWGEEMDSPRGRIYLMKAGLDGRARLDASYVRHFDACLGCLACVTACPSGVQYAPLIERTRAQIEQHYDRDGRDRIFRRALMSLLPYPKRLRIVMAPLAIAGGLVRAVGRRLLTQVATGDGPVRTAVRRGAAAMALSPKVRFGALFSHAPEQTAAAGTERMRVAVLTGCVQRIAFAGVNAATIRVLAAEGCHVSAPAAQGCCGALSLHSGAIDQARELARHNIEVFERAAVDRIVVNAAGCGSAMKDYGELFKDDAPWAERARAFSARVRDVSELLVELGEPRSPRHAIAARVAYHDACHLAHGQGIRVQPRALLSAIPGIELVTPDEFEICCGSAGIYNLVQPKPAAELGARKAKHLAALSPDMIATANPGCTLQIAASARGFGYNWPIFHPIELIDASIRGVDPRE